MVFTDTMVNIITPTEKTAMRIVSIFPAMLKAFFIYFIPFHFFRNPKAQASLCPWIPAPAMPGTG
jgi:ABC-type uncharacterized transport system permease subunit